MGCGGGGTARGEISRGAEVSGGLAVVRACGWVWCGCFVATGAHCQHEPSTPRPSMPYVEQIMSHAVWCADGDEHDSTFYLISEALTDYVGSRSSMIDPVRRLYP